MKPNEATQLTLSELVAYVNANNNRDMEKQKMLASMVYAGGILASMSLNKTRPKFEEIFKFPEAPTDREKEIELSKQQMKVWAETVNRNARRNNK